MFLENKPEYAVKLFKEGYNCSQAVLGAFCNELGLDLATVHLSYPLRLEEVLEGSGRYVGRFQPCSWLQDSNMGMTTRRTGH